MLSRDERFKKVQDTIKETEKMLNENHKCLLVRPTGFGKTFTLADIASRFDRVIYLYPRDIIKLDVQSKYKDKLGNVDITYITYTKLARWYNMGTLDKNFESLHLLSDDIRVLFIIDEAHMAGAPKASQAVEYLMKEFPKAYYLGASATPVRADKYDIIFGMFEGNLISKYGIKEAITDGMYHRPKYVYACYEMEQVLDDLEKLVQSKELSEENEKEVLLEISSYKVACSAFMNMEKVLYDNIGDKSYQKWIVFFPTEKVMFAKIGALQEWFKRAYPKHNINNLIVYSKRGYSDNIEKVQDLHERDNTIDLICCIDMLNMGYHINDITGIIMLRGTMSDIIYKQQIGRCLSVDNDNEAIIFDLVGNYLKRQYSSVGNRIIDKRGLPGDDTMDFGSELMNVVDNIKDIEEVIRLWSDTLDYDIEFYVDAYLNKSAPMEWVISGLHLKSKEELEIVLKGFGASLRDMDVDKKAVV